MIADPDIGKAADQTAGHGEAVAISIVIAAYNAADFVDQAIASAMEQASPDLTLEVLVIDDASSDETADRVTRIADANGAVRLISLPANGGPSVARNAGLDASRGKWIAVLDADDRFEPGHLASVLELAERTDADIVLANILLFNRIAGTGTPARLRLPDRQPRWTAADFVKRARPLTDELDWGLLKPIFSRKFLDANDICYPPQVRHGEDFLMLVEALRKGAALAVSPDPTYRYTTRNSGWSRTVIDYGDQIEQSQALVNEPWVHADPALTVALEERIVALHRWQARRSIEDQIDRRDYAQLWQMLRSSARSRSEFGQVVLSRLRRILGRTA